MLGHYSNTPSSLVYQPVCSFSNNNKNDNQDSGKFREDSGKFESDDEGEGKDEFESERRFSNFVLFSGSLALVILLMASNVQQMKRQKERKASDNEVSKSSTTYTGKADIGGPW